MQPDLKAVQDVFFDAMAVGWAGGVSKKGTIVEFLGSRTITFVSGHFRVVDFFLTTPDSDMSTGVTMIWYQGVPVWVMHYGGWYVEAAISFLKLVLHQAYDVDRCFYGGRGPCSMQVGGLRYANRIRVNDFINFLGEEDIVDTNDHDRLLGHHWYRGMSLLKNS